MRHGARNIFAPPPTRQQKLEFEVKNSTKVERSKSRTFAVVIFFSF